MAERRAFLLRLDPKVYEALRSWSKDELRSLNGHIEFLLRKSLRAAGRKLPPPEPPPPADDPPVPRKRGT